MANKVIVPQKNNYVPQFLKQRDINSYNSYFEEIRGPGPRWVQIVKNYMGRIFGCICNTSLLIWEK